jgi:hypothetical protein
VQTFDPLKHYGTNEARFRNYINLCLANKFRTMRSKRMKDALCHPRNLSLDGRTESEDPDPWTTNTAIPIRHTCKTQRRFRKNRQAIERFFRTSWILCGGKTLRFCPQ